VPDGASLGTFAALDPPLHRVPSNSSISSLPTHTHTHIQSVARSQAGAGAVGDGRRGSASAETKEEDLRRQLIERYGLNWLQTLATSPGPVGTGGESLDWSSTRWGVHKVNVSLEVRPLACRKAAVVWARPGSRGSVLFLFPTGVGLDQAARRGQYDLTDPPGRRGLPDQLDQGTGAEEGAT
jgi:hypothetical protein